MTPAASSPAVRDRMRAQRTRDTAPELALRGALRARGVLGYRVDHRLPAARNRRADVAYTAARVAVYVDGCFWHGCADHSRPTRAHTDWWRTKIGRNRERDRETDALLAGAGWEVVRCWEHDDMGFVADLVADLVGRRRHGGQP